LRGRVRSVAIARISNGGSPVRAWAFASATALLAVVGLGSAQEQKDEKKPTGPIVLKVVSKKDEYVFSSGGRSAKEYKTYLEDLAKKQGDEEAAVPNPLRVDLVLQFENTSKEDVTVYLGGDANAYTFELTGGAGVVALSNPGPFTLDMLFPKAVTIKAGKVHEIPVKVLADGNRGFSRFLFWTGPGEYQLVARYVLTDERGQIVTAELKSEPVKIVVAEK
jgi:hypothetical protein